MWRFDSDTDPGYWEAVDSPTNVTLRDVTSSVNGPVAVGDKGIAVGRGRERWGIVLENGPGAKGRALYAVDTTDDGKRVWFAGAGGALGYYDTVTEERRDYSVPRGNANGFYSLAVAGERGSEKFLVGDGSGHVLPGHMEDNETDWSWSTTPSGGNAVQALCHDDDGYGYAVTANGNVFMTTKEDGWERIGVDGAQNSFYNCTFDDGVFLTGGGSGMVHEAEQLLDHDDDVTWTPTDLGGFAVYGLNAGHGAQLACGEGGNVHVRMEGGDWERGQYDASTTFNAGLVDDPMIVVGGNGLIVERRDEPPEEDEDDEQATGGSGGSAGSGGTSTGDSDEGDGGTGGAEGGDADGAEGGDADGTEGGDADRTEGGDAGCPTDEVAVETDDGWDRVAAGSADGDPFDGRGENYDGDGNPPAEFDEGSAEQVVEVSTDPVESGDDDSDGDSGNDPADEPDPEDDDPADEPDQPDGSGNDESDDSGNDEADPPDEDTDSDDSSDN